MVTTNYGLIRTVQVRNENVPGVLGALSTAIGITGANIGNIQTVRISQNHVLRDIDIYVEDQEHLNETLRAIARVQGVRVIETRDEVMDLHQGGKIEIVSRQRVESIAMLRKVYTPGVAEICRAIYRDPGLARRFTSIGNTVAIITDGTAVLGLGDIGLAAAMPVMEGKSALLQQFAGVNGAPVLVNAASTDAFVDAVVSIAQTYSGIHLEDLSAPACFEVAISCASGWTFPAGRYRRRGAGCGDERDADDREAPRRHDRSDRFGGRGAVHREAPDVRQRQGAGRRYQRRQFHPARAGGRRSSRREADVVIAVPASSRRSPCGRGRSYSRCPTPTRRYYRRGALESLAADGTTVNNVLGYPGIWRGALTTRASTINQRC